MSVYRLPSGRWGAQVHVPGKGNVRVSKILGPQYASFRTKTEAKDARTEARRHVNGGHGPDGITVSAFARLWTTDRLFARPKRSTNIHNAERIQAFVDAYGASRCGMSVMSSSPSTSLAGGATAPSPPCAPCSTTP